MQDGADDLRFLIAGADALAFYLESDVLFWPLQSESQPLTIGNLLLAQKRVAAFLGGSDPQVLKADEQISQARQKRGAAWKRKASSELHARLTQYKSALMDAAEEENTGVNYPVLARLRVILEILHDEVDSDLHSDSQLTSLDGQLRRLIVDSDFVWQADLQDAFPAAKYWFLYAKYARRSA